MHRIAKRVLTVGSFVGLLVNVTAAHAVVNTGASLCAASFGSTGFGDLDFAMNGAVSVKASSDKQFVCTLPREPIPLSQTMTYFIDGSNANDTQRVTATLVATSFMGNPLGMFTSTRVFGKGNFDMPIDLPATAQPAFGYVSAVLLVPGSHNGSVLGFASP